MAWFSVKSQGHLYFTFTILANSVALKVLCFPFFLNFRFLECMHPVGREARSLHVTAPEFNASQSSVATVG